MTLVPGNKIEPPDELERLLAGHLSRELESQRGRALTAFRASANCTRMTAGAGAMQTQVSRKAMVFWAGVPSLIAACLAVVLTLHFTGNPVGNPVRPTSIEPQMVVNEELRSVPAGVTVSADGIPMQELHRQTNQDAQWTENGAIYHITQQGEKVDYIQVTPY